MRWYERRIWRIYSPFALEEEEKRVSDFGVILAILGKILDLVIDASNEIDKAEKEYEKKRQALLAALAGGDTQLINQLINEL